MIITLIKEYTTCYIKKREEKNTSKENEQRLGGKCHVCAGSWEQRWNKVLDWALYQQQPPQKPSKAMPIGSLPISLGRR